jgi:hypothetical protein
MNNDHDQLKKNMYQVPGSLVGEPFVPVSVAVDTIITDGDVNRRFNSIVQQEFERDEILNLFNKMTRKIEMAASGLDMDPAAQIESPVVHPIIATLEELKAEQVKRRIEHLQAPIERAEKMGPFVRAYVRLFEKNASQILNPTTDSIINQESSFGFEVFERGDITLDPKHDPEITEIQFFLHDDEYFYIQKSSVPAKAFIIKYTMTPVGILKSSTFLNEQLVNVHRSEIIQEDEAHNLLIAVRKHLSIVTDKVYGK